MKKYAIFRITSLFILLVTVFSFTGINKAESATIKPTNLSMYIWTNSLNTYTTDYIEKYLIANKIKTAIISSGNKTAFKTLLTKLPKKKIAVELLVGDYDLLFEENIPSYFDNLLTDIPLKNISAIHIDVEQYAASNNPNYHNDEEYYDNLYIEMIGKIKDYATGKGLKMNVDIPAFYDSELLEEIYALADNVYIMAYQINSVDSLPSKLSAEFAQDKPNTTVAFRAKDFAKKSDFNTYIDNAAIKLNTKNFALHAFKDFVELDARPN